MISCRRHHTPLSTGAWPTTSLLLQGALCRSFDGAWQSFIRNLRKRHSYRWPYVAIIVEPVQSR